MTNFYKATAVDQESFPIGEREKFKVVVIGTTKLRFRAEKLEAKVMDRQDYKKSNKEGHLITFVVKNSDKQKLKKIFDANLGDFDIEKPEAIIACLTGAGFKVEEEAEIDNYLNDELVLLEKLKSSDEKEITLSIIQEKISDFVGFIKRCKDRTENKFDADGGISNQLGELQAEIKLYLDADNNNSSGLKEINGFIAKINKIDFSISFEILNFSLHTLIELQPRFVGHVEENSLQKSIKDLSLILKKYKNEKVFDKNMLYLSDQIEVFNEITKRYRSDFDQSITESKEIVDTVARQISSLASLCLFEGKELLEKGYMDPLISKFHTDLEIQPIAELKNNAALIKEAFNAKLGLVKDAFVTGSKKTLGAINNQIFPYFNEKWAETIRKETASLDSMLNDLSMKDPKQLSEISDRLNKCDADTKEFCSEIFARESSIKTEFRKGSSNVTQFFSEKTNVLNDIQKHGEKIRNGYWGADKKAGILGDIYAQAEGIKNQHQDLMNNPTFDSLKASKLQKDITEIVNFIDKNENILSRYRGISALKPLAKLWGGGEVTSEKYIMKIKDQLNKCDNSASVWNLANAR